jgi:hypothetical protein
MNQTKYAVGDPVKITAGTYAGAEGVIADLQPECDAVRLETKEGTAYSFLESMVPLPKPRPPRRK